jgi:hypothetical protein
VVLSLPAFEGFEIAEISNISLPLSWPCYDFSPEAVQWIAESQSGDAEDLPLRLAASVP